MVARTIAVAPSLGLKRQGFFVSLGGFDNHDGLSIAPADLMTRVAGALSSFYAATVELGVADKVTAFTASDFGRTLSGNNDGSDHGWGSVAFMLGGAVSPVGHTRTAPAAGSMPATLRLAVASCQHWQFGSYAAHRHIAASSPDLVAFLGDYIYEWGAFQLDHPLRAVRANESFTLDHYRARYAQYKSDPDLQASHRVAPWIVTWDDHEVANDYANERDERLAADFPSRRAAAYQAFYEHMPLRLPPARNGRFPGVRMYQRYDWGQLARFHVLDDRQYRSVEVCAPAGRGGG